MVRRFVEEAQIGGQLQHPGIVPVYELGRFPDGRLYIAMKLVRGRTLAALLESRAGVRPTTGRGSSRSSSRSARRWPTPTARGVIHRDLKPSNVMVGAFGEVQVMDWGLAKVLDQGGVADEESAAARKRRRDGRPDDCGPARWPVSRAPARCSARPPYMAPEQARGELDTLDERADVFGLGSILCEILTGQPLTRARPGLTSTARPSGPTWRTR